MIAFTSDIDWAPEEAIQDMLGIFTQYNVPCTLFCTHKSRVIDEADRDLFEIGIHPNYNSLLDGTGTKNALQVLDDILAIFPEAKGVRSHAMTQNSTLLDHFMKRGMVYDANHFLPYQQGFKPFRLWNGLIRIPYNWEDDVHFTYGKSFESSEMELNGTDLLVFDFHPIHTFLNTDTTDTYRKAKAFYQDSYALRSYVNTARFGTRDMLISLLDEVTKRGLPTYKMIEVANKFASAEVSSAIQHA